MRSFLVKFGLTLQVVSSVLLALSIGVYINLLTGQICRLSEEGAPLQQAVINLRWWNVLLLSAVLLTLFQGILVRLPTKTLREGRDRIISSILEAACVSIIYPTMTKHIRAIVTLRDGTSGIRRTRYSYNTEGDPEMIASYPIEFGVTGEAYKTRSVVAAELPSGHHDSYPVSVKEEVLPEIKSVIAAPILHSMDSDDEPLGVLAFDSVLPLSQIKFDNLKVRRIVQSWANVIAEILKTTEI